MKKSEFQEKRRHHRITTKIRAVAIHEAAGEISLESEDMSLGGIFLRSDVPYREGAEITLRLSLSDYSKPIEVRGRVTNVRKGKGVGIEFVDLDLDKEKAIRHHLLFGTKK